MTYHLANVLLTKRFKISMLRSDLCDYSDAYVVVKGKITVEGENDAKTRNKNVIFKNNGPFRSRISNINNAFTDNAEDLDIVMSMYNLLECSDNMKSGSLWKYYRDEVNDDANKNNAANNRIKTSKR